MSGSSIIGFLSPTGFTAPHPFARIKLGFRASPCCRFLAHNRTAAGSRHPGSPRRGDFRSMPQAHADMAQNLLFGLLALQNGMISQDALLLAFHAWTQAKDRPM